MDYHHHESKYKPQNARRRSGRDNPPRGSPMRGSVTKGRVEPTPQTKFSVYDGTDRVGSFRRDGDTFEAYGRRGQLLGSFATQKECLAAIDSEAAP
jgi:hypothetical protein